MLTWLINFSNNVIYQLNGVCANIIVLTVFNNFLIIISFIKKITKGFPLPQILSIVVQPCYETIANLQLKINLNTTSVQSNFWCGHFGHLWLAVKLITYFTISAVLFVHPPNLGVTLIIPAGSTLAQISSTQFKYLHKIPSSLNASLWWIKRSSGWP